MREPARRHQGEHGSHSGETGIAGPSLELTPRPATAQGSLLEYTAPGRTNGRRIHIIEACWAAARARALLSVKTGAIEGFSAEVCPV